MKNKWIRQNLTVILIACVMWSFCVMLSISVNAQSTGPFCELCQLVTVSHITWDEYIILKASVDYSISQGSMHLGSLYSQIDQMVSSMGNVSWYMSSPGVYIPEEYMGYIQTALSDFSSASGNAYYMMNDVALAFASIQSSIDSIQPLNTEYCTTCTSSGEGGEGTGEGSCCNCPDYGPILEEMNNRITLLMQSVVDINGNLLSMKNTLDAWYVKWQAQDDKLQPLIDELKPMLPNIKKFYDDYYSADWGTATWSNIKNIVSDLTEKEIVKKWDRYYGDYFDSTMSSASWSSFGYAMGAAERVYKADTADGKTGEQTMISVLKDWQESTKHPISESYTLPSEVPDEKEYVTLNWFQRITAALGVIAFSPTNISNQVDLDFEEHEEEAKRVENAVVSLGTEVSSKFGSLYGSYKNIFDSFKNLVPRDTLPTSIRLHPGFKFDYNPAGSSGGDQSAYVLPPWDWAVQEHAIFKIALDMIRGIFGFIWWVLGFGIVYEIVVGVYGFCVSITQKAMAVFGSLGRSGGGSE